MTILLVKSPSKLSVAVAPASVYVSPTSTEILAEPVNVIVGATSSTFVMENVTALGVLTLPAASLAVTVKL